MRGNEVRGYSSYNLQGLAQLGACVADGSGQGRLLLHEDGRPSGLFLLRWSTEDLGSRRLPMTEHKRFFPTCRFVTGQDSTNVPLGEAPVVPSETNYYNKLAKQAATGHSQASGQSSLNHLTQATMRPHESLSMSTGDTTSMHLLTVTQIQEMKLESKRLESFNDWPIPAYVRPEGLAKAGVYYLGRADRVRCAFCNGILRNWQPGDEPLEKHQKHFPNCAFIKDAQAAGNVSIEEEKVNIQQASQNAVANPQPSLGVVRAEEPKSLNYSGETSRLLSFRRWPQNANQTADDLARAGFYYTGIGDSVKCFSCHGTARNWQREDDPWTEHARWFPSCNYVRTVKGDAFIRSVQAAHSGQDLIYHLCVCLGACRFPVEPRMIRARMDTTRVRSVLNMGFTRDLLYKVIENRLTTVGDDFPNVQSLMEAVFAAEEALPSSSSSRTKHERSVTNTSSTSEPATAAAAASTGADEIQTTASTSTGSSEVKPEAKATTSENRLQCKICMDDEAKILFLPCGHLCSCAKCAPALRNCPICRALIRGTVRVYLP
ncbi:hypothetical protein NP493_608g00023 [Ridgeia piscesae]|uniref:RING-type domain-containing protein n=1 Tax=Ridgeia piscesae TaxID=27915 RepID=A0AAD9NP73_RIDPI|nr:hypothetical protein NP493_608g00023 [Ridgeia piscesae]